MLTGVMYADVILVNSDLHTQLARRNPIGRRRNA